MNAEQSRFRAGIKRILLVFFGVGVGLFALEILLRVLPIPSTFELARQQIQLWQPDSDFFLHLRPNLNLHITANSDFDFTVVTNSQGLRDDEWNPPVDLATIGDSFTFGLGVEQSEAWPIRLEALSGLQVANLGYAGWNSYTYGAAIRRYAVPLGARLWIWAFFLNDLPESVGLENFPDPNRAHYISTFTGHLFPPFPYNLRVFELLAALNNPQRFMLSGVEGQALGEYSGDGPVRMRLTNYAWLISDPASPEIQRGWEITESALSEAKQLADEHQATLLVVFVPVREHTYWPLIHGQMAGYDVQQLDDAVTHLADIAAARDLPFFSLVPGFQEAAIQQQMLYYPNDGHWNAAGHDLAARLIYDKLLQENLLPE